LTVTTRYKKESNGGKLIFDRSSTKQIFTQKSESLGFQMEHQINGKVDAFSRGIQPKIHLKFKY